MTSQFSLLSFFLFFLLFPLFSSSLFFAFFTSFFTPFFFLPVFHLSCVPHSVDPYYHPTLLHSLSLYSFLPSLHPSVSILSNPPISLFHPAPFLISVTPVPAISNYYLKRILLHFLIAFFRFSSLLSVRLLQLLLSVVRVLQRRPVMSRESLQPHCYMMRS